MIKAGLESGMEEERTGTFTHVDFGAATVQRMVKWVNDRSYHVAEEGGHRGLSDARKRGYLTFDGDRRVINDILLAHVAVHGIAEFYCMENLKAYARKRFDDAARFGWHEDGFLHVVREVYRTTADRPYGADLRDMLCDYALKWRTQLLMFSDDLKNDPSLQEFGAMMFVRTVNLATKEKNDCMQLLRVQTESYNKLKSEKSDLAKNLEREKGAIEALNKVIPTLPGTCPNITCGLEFPANLSIARDKWWKIRCSVCGSDVCRVEEKPAVGGDDEHPYILEPEPV